MHPVFQHLRTARPLNPPGVPSEHAAEGTNHKPVVVRRALRCLLGTQHGLPLLLVRRGSSGGCECRASSALPCANGVGALPVLDVCTALPHAPTSKLVHPSTAALQKTLLPPHTTGSCPSSCTVRSSHGSTPQVSSSSLCRSARQSGGSTSARRLASPMTGFWQTPRAPRMAPWASGRGWSTRCARPPLPGDPLAQPQEQQFA